MTSRENHLRAFLFKNPEHIPISMYFSPSYIKTLGNDEKKELWEMISAHKLLFSDFPKERLYSPVNYLPWQRTGIEYKDSWGCIWKTSDDGITGSVKKHVLDDWSSLDDLKIPDPSSQNGWGEIDWKDISKHIAQEKVAGSFIAGNLRHGFLFLTMQYMRGYENIIYDMYDEDENLPILIDIIESFNMGILDRYLKLGIDIMHFPEDLGMQNSPMITIEYFKKYIKPSYQRLMKKAKDSKVIIYLHSDGFVLDLIDDLFLCGVEVFNIQDLVNGLDNIAKYIKGKAAIDLDIDRQSVTRFGSPKDIDNHIKESVTKLSDPKGGLKLSYGVYPGIPAENLKTLMDAMESYCKI